MNPNLAFTNWGTILNVPFGFLPTGTGDSNVPICYVQDSKNLKRENHKVQGLVNVLPEHHPNIEDIIYARGRGLPDGTSMKIIVSSKKQRFTVVNDDFFSIALDQ